MTADPGGSGRVDSVSRALRTLEELEARGDAGVTEIARALGIAKGTAYNHLNTLERNGYVVRNEGGTYSVGFRFLELAHHARERVPIHGIVRSEIDRLAERSGEMAVFTVEEHGESVCLYRARGERAVRTELYAGYRSPLHSTAVGKAILSRLPPGEVEAIIERRGLPAITDATITDRDRLLDELETVRETGVAYNRDEAIPGLAGIGVPLRGEVTIRGGISVIGPASRITDESVREEQVRLLRESADTIEVNSTSV